MRFTRIPVLSFAALLAFQLQASATDSEPLAPFYPAKIQIPSYNPAKFIPATEAKAALPQGALRERDFSSVVSLDGDWRISGLENASEPFAANADLDKDFANPAFDDSNWDSIKVPLNWYKKYPKAVKKDAPYVKGWYRKALDIPASAAGQSVIVHFDVVGYEGLLFVNGKEAGRHHGDFTPWNIDITKFVEAGKPTTLALRVFSDFGPNFGVKAQAKHAYGSQWGIDNIKGGIWQHAELRIEPQVRVVEALVSPDLANSSINVDCIIRNDSATRQTASLLAAISPAEAALAKNPAEADKVTSLTLEPGDSKLSFSLKLDKPRLWSPENPNLYHLILPLSVSGKTISVKSFRFGYRSFKTEGDHFLLNGDRIYLFGENIPVVRFGGNGESQDDLRAKFADYMIRFKSIGYNIVRNPHMPVVPEALQVADEVGMMLYDEWCWSFTKSLDPVEFEKNNLEEIPEWIKRDYNSPCAVMWSCGNEVYYGENKVTISNLNKQVQLVRSLDKSGRPVSTFSGAAHDYGTMKLDTDVLDLHKYLGLGEKPWPFWEKAEKSVESDFLKSYAGTDGKLPIPLIVWECVGFSWGENPDKSFSKDKAEDYIKYVRKTTEWGHPNGIGWTGAIGLAAALDPAKGAKHGMAEIGRRIMDYMRQDTGIEGFAPWFHNADLEMALIWNQPVYCGLRGEGAVPLRNVFAGAKYSQTAFVVSSTVKNYEGGILKVVLHEADGSEKVLTSWELGKIQGWTKSQKDLEFSMPQGGANRWAQLRSIITDKSGAEISRNFYDIFIASPEIAKIASGSTAGVLATGDDGEKSITKILVELGVKVQSVAKPEDLEGLKTLILPAADTAPAILAGNTQMNSAILNWIRNGGTYLSLEQGWRGAAPVLSRQLMAVQGVFADLAVSNHPAFKGLTQANFEFWNNPVSGETASVGLTPVGNDLIAARGPMLGNRETFGILSDGTLGQGRIIASQFDACKLWRSDSAATIYLRNILESALGQAPKSLKSWEEYSDEITVTKDAKIISIDLKLHANMGFKDEKEGDGKGGWTDQGDNDFRMMPLGRQTLRKVAFDIIDPATNNGKSCLVLRPEAKGDIVNSIKGVKVGAKLSRLFFLHTAAWISSSGTVVANYTVNYADGSSVAIPVIDGISISDWWQCGSLPGAKLALTRSNSKGHEVGLTLMEWNNPHPELTIESIDFAANTGKSIDFAAAASSKAMTVVVAVSGEKASDELISISGKWSALAEASHDKLLHDGPLVPTLESVPAEGKDAVRISFPAKAENAPKPIVFRSFLPAEKAKLTKDAPLRYLTVEVKAESDFVVEFSLPKDDWTDSLRSNVVLKADGQWHAIRLRLNEDLKLDAKNWTLKDLRGEFFIYGDRKLESKPLSFIVRSIRME